MVGYAAPLILAAITVGQQLLSGDAQGAVIELVQNLAQDPI